MRALIVLSINRILSEEVIYCKDTIETTHYCTAVFTSQCSLYISWNVSKSSSATPSGKQQNNNKYENRTTGSVCYSSVINICKQMPVMPEKHNTNKQITNTESVIIYHRLSQQQQKVKTIKLPGKAAPLVSRSSKSGSPCVMSPRYSWCWWWLGCDWSMAPPVNE